MELHEFDNLVDSILEKEYSLVDRYGFVSIYNEREKVMALEGDIIELGVFKGGMSLFLTKLFPNKKIWLVDSFEKGFPDPNTLKYPYPYGEDPHKPTIAIRLGDHGVPSSFAKSVFEEYGEGNNPNVNIVEGYVSDVLPTLNIDKISLLRIDVDSYSATKEILEALYPKVVEGGMIIFDDNNIDTGRLAVEDWLKENGLPDLFHCSFPPFKVKAGTGSPCDYIFKGENFETDD